MSDFFELDIKKYTLDELKDMLDLREGFTLEDVVKKEDVYFIVQSLNESGEFSAILPPGRKYSLHVESGNLYSDVHELNLNDEINDVKIDFDLRGSHPIRHLSDYASTVARFWKDYRGFQD